MVRYIVPYPFAPFHDGYVQSGAHVRTAHRLYFVRIQRTKPSFLAPGGNYGFLRTNRVPARRFGRNSGRGEPAPRVRSPVSGAG